MIAEFEHDPLVPEPPQLTPRGWLRLERLGEISLGSVGHPHSCSLPCKYFRRARGCKEGKNCTRCHVCCWRACYKRVVKVRDALDREDEDSSTEPPSVLSDGGDDVDSPPSPTETEPPIGLGLSLSPASLLEPMKIASEVPAAHWSLGSVGHPLNCAAPCKYKNRKGGCRDGRQCLCCHICQWTRQGSSKPAERPDMRAYQPGSKLVGAVQAEEHAGFQPGFHEAQARRATWQSTSLISLPYPMGGEAAWDAQRPHLAIGGEAARSLDFQSVSL
mmetsp:Transcript_36584/g.84115  ORF Transcript_36584/g.84115 Transcript_36584/m.84115 type:complete len:274 (+) Transcript_36584:67-888(+)